MTCSGWQIRQIILIFLKQFHENFHSKTPRCRKLSHSSNLQNDALLHREAQRVVHLSVCLPVCLSQGCASVCLPVCMSVLDDKGCLLSYVCLSVCLSLLTRGAYCRMSPTLMTQGVLIVVCHPH